MLSYKEAGISWSKEEQVANDLLYYSDNETIRVLIIATICRLPDEVAEFALDRCNFVSIGEEGTGYGIVLPGRIGVHPGERRSKNIWIIVLAENLPDEDSHSIIAHEIAHAWLGHDRVGEIPEDCETQASDLVRQWGFTGRGANLKPVE